MTVNMSKTIQEERWKWIKPIIEKKSRLVDVSKICPHSKRSLERWCSLYRKNGIEGLTPKSTRPHTHPKETPICIKERIISKKKETKLCALKIHWKLKKEGLIVPTRTIGKILKEEGLVKKYRKKKLKYKYIKVQRLPGELMEIDVKYVPGRIKSKKYYQYTAIDTASRWRYLRVFDEQSSFNSIEFLRDCIHRFPYSIQAIKTDNGSVFTNYYLGTNKRSDQTVKTQHSLDEFCRRNNIIHYLIDPGKPTQNGTVERSHREDQEKFYDMNKFKSFSELQKKIKLWNTYYNNLEHCGLNGRTPMEMLE